MVNIGDVGNIGYAGYNDAIYRQRELTFTARRRHADISFADGGLQGLGNESWGIDNVAVTQGATTAFSDDFEAGIRPQWSDDATDAGKLGVFSRFSGRFSGGAQVLSLSGLNASQSYTLSFDLYILDSWDGNSSSAGPDQFEVSADGTLLMRDTFSNYSAGNVQSYNTSAGMALQIVPTLTGMSGRPGSESYFDLLGSGFMEGDSTIAIGGVSLADAFSNQFEFNVTGSRNSDYRVVAPLALDGPVRVTTAGGFAEIAGPVFAPQPAVQFTGIQASAGLGTAGDVNQASANAGQVIVLQGQGFTSQTLVQFAGVDDGGVAGTITRTGTAGNNGTTLSIEVPALAKSGMVHVLGTGSAFMLQVVPVLRSVGGTVASGNTIELEGSGLVGSELQIAIDGQGVGTFQVRTLTDNTGSSFDSQQMQQIVTLTVPNGVGAGVITAATNGGSSTLRHRGLTTDADDVAAADVGDTLATARNLMLGLDHSVTLQVTVGDGANGNEDVDLYRLDLGAGDIVSFSTPNGSGFDGYARVFDAAGQPVATADDSPGSYTATSAGTYYLGLSGYSNTGYDPTVDGSGSNGQTGTMAIALTRRAAGSTALSSIDAAAGSGTAAVNGVASANTGQTITIHGSNLQPSQQVVFTGIDSGGRLYSSTATAATVAGDGSSLTVVVPNDATTGTVRLPNEQVGLFLQIVPTLADVTGNAGQSFAGSSLQLSGSGFAEGLSAVNFGATTLSDSGRSTGLNGSTTVLSLTTPDAVPTGPISVTTVGGTSTVFARSFTGLTAAADSGTPADGNVASANPGQTITVLGSGLSVTTEVVFTTSDASGNVSDIIVVPSTVAADGSSADVVVPYTAITGTVRVIGDTTANAIALQIVPVVTGVDIQYLDSDGSSTPAAAHVALNGFGFIEGRDLGFIVGEDTVYAFGGTQIPDPGSGSGPDVSYRYDSTIGQYIDNGIVYLSVPLAGSSGPIVVQTAGGTSAPFSLDLDGITATAMSGTPADAGEASANAGQAIVLNGSGLSTASDILLTYVDSGGNQRTVDLNPTAAAGDGTSATLVVPDYANGAFAVQMLGATGQPLLQVVPTLTSFNVSGSTLQLFGSGFVEGNGSYQLAGANVSDLDTGSGPNVFNSGGDNHAVNIAEPMHGFGPVTATTAGGISAALDVNELDAGLGYLRDVAFDAAAGTLWVVDNNNPKTIDRIDPATGQSQLTFTITSADFGSTAFIGGLQVAPAAFNLNGTAVAAGSLLVFTGSPNPDRVVALDPSDGSVIASLTLDQNYDMSSGVYDPASGNLFILDRRGSPDMITAIDPADGTAVSSFAAPFDAGESGLALDPVTGNLWYGAESNGEIVELTTAGAEVRRVDLSLQGDNVGSNGLAFDADGKLLVASNQGVVYRVEV